MHILCCHSQFSNSNNIYEVAKKNPKTDHEDDLRLLGLGSSRGASPRQQVTENVQQEQDGTPVQVREERLQIHILF